LGEEGICFSAERQLSNNHWTIRLKVKGSCSHSHHTEQPARDKSLSVPEISTITQSICTTLLCKAQSKSSRALPSLSYFLLHLPSVFKSRTSLQPHSRSLSMTELPNAHSHNLQHAFTIRIRAGHQCICRHPIIYICLLLLRC
jgi:hypothetical protein